MTAAEVRARFTAHQPGIRTFDSERVRGDHLLDPGVKLPPGLTREEFLAKLVPPAPAMSHSKGTAGIVGLFVKPQ